jgi:hypothetical protein
MRSIFGSGTLAAILIAVLSAPAYAQHGGHGGGGYSGHGGYGGGYGGHGGGYYGGHGGYHGYGGYGGWGWGGFAFGAAVTSLAYQSAYWPAYSYYGSPYYAPYYTEPIYAAPQTYVEQQPIAPSVTAASWYYCRESKAYYPYVKTCKAGWQTVPTVPPDR